MLELKTQSKTILDVQERLMNQGLTEETVSHKRLEEPIF
jgi:hypothetical protein